MKKTKILKSQKPTDIDCHFKYICPNKDCNNEHWLSIQQIKTKNFKVVCDCYTIFKPKTVSKLKLVYVSSKKQKQTIPVDTLDTCVKLLVGYGYDTEDAKNKTTIAYNKTKNKSVSSLVKYIMQNLEN